MKTVLLYSIAFFISIVSCCGQDVEEEASIYLKSPVRFIPIDSLSTIQRGQKVKLDFKTKNNIERYPLYYPSLRGARQVPDDIHWYGDTINLTIDRQKIEFVERKGKTTDYYLFMLELLESKTYKQGHLLIIPHSTIQEVRNDSILFRLTIELYKQKSNGHLKKVNSKTRNIWIDKRELDGVLISEIEEK